MAMKAGPWLSPPNGRGIVYTRGILRVINMRGTIKSDSIIPSLDWLDNPQLQQET